ncbi:hypothetical protein [Thiolapillus sp.]
MKKQLLSTVAGGCLLTATLAAAGDRTPEPIKTLSPETGSEIEIKFSYDAFTGVELDEVEEFDGWTAIAEVSMPFMEKFRLRLSYPFKTEGDAVVKADHFIMPGESIDVDGNGGVFDFLTITFEHQLKSAEEEGYGLAYYLGGGAVPSRLDTTLARPGSGYDAINHTGSVFLAGVKLDRYHSFGHGLLNLGLRYYGSSDDLNPGNSDQFVVADLKAALVFNPWGSVYPVMELTYLGDFSDMNQFTIYPELVFPIGKHVDLKAGAAIGLGGNGNEFGGQAQIGIKF